MFFSKGLTWKGPMPIGNEVYLTFDDGPHPEVTNFVLDLLDAYEMKGTFFCIGENVKKYPATYQKLLDAGHATGNHTFHHINGFKTKAVDYLAEIDHAAQFIKSKLFRPPYGRITRKQVALLKEKQPDTNMVMWSVVTGDFDESKTGEWCFQQIIKHAKAGSIIVFHDSERAFDRLKEALPLTLQWLKQNQLASKPLVS